MPPPTGVVSGPLMPTQVLLEGLDGLVGQPVVGLLERLLAGEHFLPLDLALALVGLLDGGVEDAHAGAPDVAAGAVTFDEGDDGAVRGLDGAVGGDLDRIHRATPCVYAESHLTAASFEMQPRAGG